MSASAAFDVLIAGAGPAGSATAIALARRGLRVGLFERSWFRETRVGESLPPGVQPLLRELGVWEQLIETVPHVASFGGMSVWGDDEPRAQSYMAQRFSSGFHVERKDFDHMLAEAARAAGAALQLGAAVERCERERDGYRVSVLRGAERFWVSTRVLIDATGRRAHVSRQLGAQRVLFDRAVAVAARWQLPTQSYLLVEAAAPGWFYSAPLADATLSVMWMTDADLCGELPLAAAIQRAPWTAARVQMLSTVATQSLEAALESTPARAAGASALARQTQACATPLASDRGAGVPLSAAGEPTAAHASDRVGGARVYCAHSQRVSCAPSQLAAAGPCLAVGDAALAVDPIAGDGVLRALRCARRAAETALQLLATPQSERELVAAYAAERDAECTRYLLTRLQYYAAESRFDSPYWQRRARVAQQLTAAGRTVTPR